MSSGFVGSVATAFGHALRPLADALTSEEEFSRLLARHGWEAPADSLDIAEVQQLIDVQGEFTQFADLMEQAAGADPIQAALLVRDAIDELKSVLDKVTQLVSYTANGTEPFPFGLAEFWAEFPGELVEALFVDYIEAYQPSIAGPLVFLGVIEHVEASPSGTGRIDYVRPTLRWERLPELLQPQVLIDTLFVAETGELLAQRLIDTVAIAFLVEGMQGVLVEPDTALVDAYYTTDNPARDDLVMVLLPLLGGEAEGGQPFGLGLTVLPIPPSGSPEGEPAGVAIGPAVSGAPTSIDLGPFSAELSGGFVDDRGLQLELRAGGISVAPALADGVFAELKIVNDPGDPVVLIGSRDGDRLEARSISVGVRAEGTPQGVELRFGIGFDGVALVFDSAVADEFTTKVVGADEQRIGFSTGLTWSSRHGLTFRGQLSLDSHVPVTARFGPVALDSVTLSLTTADGGLTFAAGGNGRGRFGPLTIVVNGLGLAFAVRPVGAGGPLGNLGVLDVDWSFRAPSGYGLELDVSDTIQGGGFLERDDANDRWVGAIDVAIDRFRFSGLVVSERDSLIGVLWFEGLKIPLFGGVITGIGLVVAYHRRSDREAFLGGLKSGSLEALMFPTDPVAQAPVLAATLTRLLVYDADRSVAGLLARWVFGESAELVVVDLGLLVEFTDADLQKVIVIGRGRARLKDLSEDQFRLNVELYGEWDLGRGELLVVASLRDSRLVGGELSGDGMLYSGPLAGFILSVGGFNPRYAAPAGLPELRRLSARIVDSDNVKLGVELYFALTSASVQFGVKATLWAGASGFSITGTFQLDALMRFDFSFVVDLEFSVVLRRGSTVLASIGFAGTLEGTSPLELDGKAKLKLLFFSVTVPVSLQIGDDVAVTQPAVDAFPPLREALEAAENWDTGDQAAIVLARGDRSGVWASPEGALRVSQQAVPFETSLTRLGPSPLIAPQRFEVSSVDIGGLRTTTTVAAEFSIGLFTDLDLQETIGAPLTESLTSGFRVGADVAAAGVAVAGNTTYEEIVVDEPLGEPTESTSTMRATVPVRTPKAPYPTDERRFYRSPTSVVRVSEPRFITVNDNLEPDTQYPAPVLTSGLTYTAARELGRATATGYDRVVRRHEVAPA